MTRFGWQTWKLAQDLLVNPGLRKCFRQFKHAGPVCAVTVNTVASNQLVDNFIIFISFFIEGSSSLVETV